MEPTLMLAALVLMLVLYKYVWPGQQKTGIPGPQVLPIVGSGLQVNPAKIHHQFYDFARKYGHMFEMQMFGTKMVVLNSVDSLYNAFQRNGQFFSDRSKVFLAEYLNAQQSILFRKADKVHNFTRKSFVKGIHAYGIGIPKFEGIIKGEITTVMKQLEEFDEQDFEVTTIINRSFTNIMSILLIGEKATDEEAKLFAEFTALEDFFLNPFLDKILDKIPVLLHVPYFKRKMDRVLQIMRILKEKFLTVPQKSRTDGNIRGLTDWFLQDRQENKEIGGMLTDEALESIILMDVLSAGILTTSSTVSSIIICLVNHPEYQTKLQEEIDRVIGNKREPTINDKRDCPFADAIVLETMRYITTVPIQMPRLSSEDIELEGYNIKADTQVTANFWFILHDEKIWGDPWTFRPERFLDENGKLLPNNHQFMKSWVPFGWGCRLCPGRAMATTRIFLYLTMIFQRWTFEPTPGKCGSCDPRSDDFVYGFLFKPKPFYCKAKQRNGH